MVATTRTCIYNISRSLKFRSKGSNNKYKVLWIVVPRVAFIHTIDSDSLKIFTNVISKTNRYLIWNMLSFVYSALLLFCACHIKPYGSIVEESEWEGENEVLKKKLNQRANVLFYHLSVYSVTTCCLSYCPAMIQTI